MCKNINCGPDIFTKNDEACFLRSDNNQTLLLQNKCVVKFHICMEPKVRFRQVDLIYCYFLMPVTFFINSDRIIKGVGIPKEQLHIE